MFKCRHEWEKVAEKQIKDHQDHLVDDSWIYHDTNDKRKETRTYHGEKYILILVCKKCGTLDKTITGASF